MNEGIFIHIYLDQLRENTKYLNNIVTSAVFLAIMIFNSYLIGEAIIIFTESNLIWFMSVK
ncbi:hypothetical protein GCM10022410_17920 [Amphibacillus indicireducens]|uniref:Uncharacterized protein n=1 Tax=Amphibacillus indicireducens TaxID=1076330 RepID=A0ABP7VSC2_9BACI